MAHDDQICSSQPVSPPSTAAGSQYDRAELPTAINFILFAMPFFMLAAMLPGGAQWVVLAAGSVAVVVNLAYLTHRMVQVRRIDYVILFCVFVAVICFFTMCMILAWSPYFA